MEYIKAKLRVMKQKEKWDYGHDFCVIRDGVRWLIFKSGILDVSSSNIEEIAKEIKMTFIALEINQSYEGQLKEWSKQLK